MLEPLEELLALKIRFTIVICEWDIILVPIHNLTYFGKKCYLVGFSTNATMKMQLSNVFSGF